MAGSRDGEVDGSMANWDGSIDECMVECMATLLDKELNVRPGGWLDECMDGSFTV